MGAGLFAKLVVLVLALGGTAVGVLALRQSRLQAGHEAAEARLRMRAHQERAMELRTRIAARVAPESLLSFAGEPGLIHAIDAMPPEPHAVTRDPDDAQADRRVRP
ncbi:MAG: hypothetical protein AAGA55_08520 [Planctomycetota bacterium]